jgi:hypothetical protein
MLRLVEKRLVKTYQTAQKQLTPTNQMAMFASAVAGHD